MTSFFKRIYKLAAITITLADFWLLFTQQLMPFVQSFHHQLAVVSILMHLIAAATLAGVMHRTYWRGVGDEWSASIGIMAAAGALLLTTGLWHLSAPVSLTHSIVFLFMVVAGGSVLHVAAKMQWAKWFA